MTQRRWRPALAPGFLLLPAALIAAPVAMPVHAESAAAPAAPSQADCFEELRRDGGRDFACTYPAWLTEQERADLEKVTRGYLKNARCLVSIRIERARLAQAMVAPDLEFQSPPQPVSCDITTSSSTFTIKATFAPRVVFKGGEAIEATPGRGGVEGVNKYLAWPVVQYVNRAPGIRADMLKVINGYRNYVRAQRQAREGN